MCSKPIYVRAFDTLVPCGLCLLCRSRYARGWAIRCVHEASLHEESCFGTLTYDDEHLPKARIGKSGRLKGKKVGAGSLDVEDFQLFMKRLRKSIEPRKVRYYHAGEYGEVNCRPHYHFLIFGYMPRELDPLQAKSGYPLYRSAELEKLWPSGLSSVGHVSFESARYVANYVMKKVDKKSGTYRKWSCDPVTGEMHEIEPEYSTMSRGGAQGHGLGYGWYEKWNAEVRRLDSIRHAGREVSVPRYYDGLLRERDEAAYQLMKLRRERKRGARMRKDDPLGHKEALAREVIARKRLEDLQRRL